MPFDICFLILKYSIVEIVLQQNLDLVFLGNN